MKRPNHIIAIDPDIDKNGVSYLETATKKLEVSNLTLVQLIDYLKTTRAKLEETKETLTIVVEGGWSNTRTHRRSSKDTFGTASKKGYNVGRNHQRGIDIFQIAESMGFHVVEQPPLQKCWKGREGKITHEELAYFTGIMGQTNQETRDATLIAWNYANFPIRIKNN